MVPPLLTLVTNSKEILQFVHFLFVLEIEHSILYHMSITCRTVALKRKGKYMLNHSPIRELTYPLQ